MKYWFSIKILLFFGLISGPLLLNIFSGSIQMANIEKRSVAQLPPWPKKYEELTEFKQELIDFAATHFGGRDIMLNWLSNIKYRVFSESISKRVSIGKNGYVFMNSHDESTQNSLLLTVCNSERKRLKELDSAVQKLSNLSSRHNAEHLILVVPTKSVVYSEHLPNEIIEECGRNETNWIQKWAGNHADVVYPVDQYIAWKKDIRVFFKKRFHWIGDLPYQTAEWVLNRWGMVFHSQLFTSINTSIESDLAAHLYGLDFSVQDRYYLLSEDIKVCQNPTCLNGFKKHYAHGRLKTYHSNVNNNRLLLLTDSFGPIGAQYFAGGFGEVYATNLNHLKRSEEKAFLNWAFKAVQPTHVIYLIHDGGTIWQMKRLNRALD